jgi:hypothetical protein
MTTQKKVTEGQTAHCATLEIVRHQLPSSGVASGPAFPRRTVVRNTKPLRPSNKAEVSLDTVHTSSAGQMRHPTPPGCLQIPSPNALIKLAAVMLSPLAVHE